MVSILPHPILCHHPIWIPLFFLLLSSPLCNQNTAVKENLNILQCLQCFNPTLDKHSLWISKISFVLIVHLQVNGRTFFSWRPFEQCDKRAACNLTLTNYCNFFRFLLLDFKVFFSTSSSFFCVYSFSGLLLSICHWRAWLLCSIFSM